MGARCPNKRWTKELLSEAMRFDAQEILAAVQSLEDAQDSESVWDALAVMCDYAKSIQQRIHRLTADSIMGFPGED